MTVRAACDAGSDYSRSTARQGIVKPELSSRQSECQRQGAKTNFAQVQAAICARQEQMHDGSLAPATVTLSAQICIEMNEHAVTSWLFHLSARLRCRRATLPLRYHGLLDQFGHRIIERHLGAAEVYPPLYTRNSSKLDAMRRTLILRAQLEASC